MAARPKRKKTTKKRSKKTDNLDLAGRGRTMSEDDLEAVWGLFAAGMSRREIARETGWSETSIRRRLAKNPERRIEIEQSIQEQRQKQWQRIETRSIEQVIECLDGLRAAMTTLGGKPRKRLSDHDRFVIRAFPAAITALASLSDKAGRQQGQLVRSSIGSPFTEPTTQTPPEQLSQWSVEEIIVRARRLGMMDQLPPAIVEMARDPQLPGDG